RAGSEVRVVDRRVVLPARGIVRVGSAPPRQAEGERAHGKGGPDDSAGRPLHRSISLTSEPCRALRMYPRGGAPVPDAAPYHPAKPPDDPCPRTIPTPAPIHPGPDGRQRSALRPAIPPPDPRRRARSAPLLHPLRLAS